MATEGVTSAARSIHVHVPTYRAQHFEETYSFKECQQIMGNPNFPPTPPAKTITKQKQQESTNNPYLL